MSKKLVKIDLDTIKDPSFLKDLSYKELEVLSEDIRNYIIDSVSKNGGHLSSNLGVVESTIALNRIFNFKKDKLLFDVGHQCYTHKILTGRSLSNLRKKGCISGFPKISESEYDCFEGGHSSNSISNALGFALKRDIDKSSYDIVVFIGDSSISNGLAFEALNDDLIQKHKIIIILNDNEMSISKTVGSTSKFLQKISTSVLYNKLKVSYKNSLNKNKVGKSIYRTSYKIKNFIKNFFFRKNLFTLLNLNYIGVIDGHNIKAIEKALRKAKNSTKSVIVHIKTIKGLGYKYAQEDEVGYYHGVTPFKINGDNLLINSNSYSYLYSDLMKEILKKDKNVFLLSPATLVGSDLERFKEEFPEQIIDVGIAEEHCLSLASGMALSGLKPYIFIYSTFLQRGFDQVIHDIARENANVTLMIDRCGFVGEDGSSHLGIFDEAFLLEVPNTIVCMASDKELSEQLIKISYSSKKFMCIRFPKANYLERYKNDYTDLKIGEWKYTINKNSDKVIVTFGPCLNDFYDHIIKENLNIDLINAIFQNPINKNQIINLLKYKTIIIYNGYGIENGFNCKIIYALNKLNYKNKILSYAIKKEFIDHQSIYECIKSENLLVDDVLKDLKWVELLYI